MKLETNYGKYEVEAVRSSYLDNGSLYVGLVDMDDNCPFADLTVNLMFGFADEKRAYVDTNNCPWAEKFIKANKLGKPTGEVGYSGYCVYPLYEFNVDKIRVDE